eukprot:COSAG04_NODE_209_length_20232_cov_116.817315_30_plen_101_part_00
MKKGFICCDHSLTVRLVAGGKAQEVDAVSVPPIARRVLSIEVLQPLSPVAVAVSSNTAASLGLASQGRQMGERERWRNGRAGCGLTVKTRAPCFLWPSMK